MDPAETNLETVSCPIFRLAGIPRPCVPLSMSTTNTQRSCSKAGRKGGCESCRNTDLDPPTPIMAPIVLPSGPNIEPTSRQCNCIPGPTTTFAPKAFLNGPPGGSTKDKYYGQIQRLFNSKPSSCRSPNPPILENDYTQ